MQPSERSMSTRLNFGFRHDLGTVSECLGIDEIFRMFGKAPYDIQPLPFLNGGVLKHFPDLRRIVIAQYFFPKATTLSLETVQNETHDVAHGYAPLLRTRILMCRRDAGAPGSEVTMMRFAVSNRSNDRRKA